MQTRIVTLLGAVATFSVALPAATRAQVPTQDLVWSFHGLAAGNCIHFLMPWDQAEDQLPSGQVPSRADQTPGLEAALAGEIAREPQYAAWVPARLCWFGADSAEVGGHWTRIKKDPRRLIDQPVAVGYWAVAIVSKDDSTAHAWSAVDMFSTAGDLRQSLVPFRYDVSSAKMRITTADSSPDARYELDVNKTSLEWDGHAGDTVVAGRAADTLAVGRSYVRLTLAAQLGDSTFEPLGNLRVSGKGDLAKAMAAGPIRMVGPFRRGPGPLVWRFKR